MDPAAMLLLHLALDANRPDPDRCKHCGEALSLDKHRHLVTRVSRIDDDEEESLPWDEEPEYSMGCEYRSDGEWGVHERGWVDRKRASRYLDRLDKLVSKDNPDLEAAKENYQVLSRGWSGTELELLKASLSL